MALHMAAQLHQVLQPPSGVSCLADVTYYMRLTSGPAIRGAPYLFEWTGSVATGSFLFSGPDRVLSTATTLTPITQTFSPCIPLDSTK